MMKVCGFTVIKTPNYGTVLQAFALQEAVKQLGHEYTLLDYYDEAQVRKFTFFGKTKFMNNKYWIAKKVLFPLRKYQMHKILGFSKKNIHYSHKLRTEKDLVQISSQYDVFITGSDQVWNNQEISHFDSNYYLKFAKGKNTLSYAASFGKTYEMLTEEDISFYKANIPYVKNISVREDSGVDIVENTIHKAALLVCDPVYLVDSYRWCECAVSPKIQKYILLYLVGDGINFDVNKKILTFAKDYAKRFNLKIKVVGIGLSSVLYGAIKTPTVEEWLGLIQNAEFIMTNAFHGMAFSVIFHKEFYCFVRGNQNNRMNTRIYSNLKIIGLEDRIVGIENFERSRFERIPIEYSNVLPKLECFVNSSKKFLKESLENDKE